MTHNNLATTCHMGVGALRMSLFEPESSQACDKVTTDLGRCQVLYFLLFQYFSRKVTKTPSGGAAGPLLDTPYTLSEAIENKGKNRWGVPIGISK
jgi:hypothetical protein